MNTSGRGRHLARSQQLVANELIRCRPTPCQDRLGASGCFDSLDRVGRDGKELWWKRGSSAQEVAFQDARSGSVLDLSFLQLHLHSSVISRDLD